MSRKSLGVLSIVLGSLGILAGLEELAAGALAGAFAEGFGRLLAESRTGVIFVGVVLLVMSALLLVTGILLAKGRGATFARVWGVLGLIAAPGLVVHAILQRELVAAFAEKQVAFPGFLADLGPAKIPVLALLIVLPIALLIRAR